MKLDLFVNKDGKRMRCGWTTGSCAAAAAKAAVLLLESGEIPTFSEIDTPAGIPLKLPVEAPVQFEDAAQCAIRKDAGDDPDTTDGILIYARVSRRTDREIRIDGGEGIGRIRRRGLFGEVGEAAINPVPRRMICEEVRKISEHGYDVLIFAPEGEAIGRRTYNKNIGIEGGISIIGTQGIVYPMSEEALIKTIHLEIDGVIVNGEDHEILFVPGSHGGKLAEELGWSLPRVIVSNYLGESLQYAYDRGFRRMVLLGHIGKLSKLSMGIFNTHNRTADTRMEAFVYYLALMGAPTDLMRQVSECLTAEEASSLLLMSKYRDVFDHMSRGAEQRVRKYLKDEQVEVQVILYSMEKGVL